MSCMICGKPTASKVTVCSEACAKAAKQTGRKKIVTLEEMEGQAVAKDLTKNEGKKGAAKGKSFSEVQHKLEQAKSIGNVASPIKYYTIQHKNFRNRVLTSNNTVMAFNDQGIAKVQDMGNAIIDIQSMISAFPGRLWIVEDEAPVVQKKAIGTPKPEVKVEPIIDKTENIEDLKESEDPESDESSQTRATRKYTKKSPVTKN